MLWLIIELVSSVGVFRWKSRKPSLTRFVSNITRDTFTWSVDLMTGGYRRLLWFANAAPLTTSIYNQFLVHWAFHHAMEHRGRELSRTSSLFRWQRLCGKSGRLKNHIWGASLHLRYTKHLFSHISDETRPFSFSKALGYIRMCIKDKHYPWFRLIILYL